MEARYVIAIIGGTGQEGFGLAMRFAHAGENVIIGSRSAERAAEATEKVASLLPNREVRGMSNAEAAKAADIVFVAVPIAGHVEALKSISGVVEDKVVVDVVVPLEFVDRQPRIISVAEGSAAEQAQALLPRAKVVSGFHHLDASELAKVEKPIDADVIICGNDRDAKSVVMALTDKIEGVRAIDGGVLAVSRYVEGFTAALISVNRHYKTHSAIKITGV